MFLTLRWLAVFIFTMINQGISSEVTDADVRVLEVDGGGIRGAYAAAALGLMHTDLENSDSENKYEHRICDFFKGGMSGTSTGSFIVLALAAPFHKMRDGEEQSTVEDAPQGFANGPYTPKEIGDFYDVMGDQIFKCWTPANCYENCFDCPIDICSRLSRGFSNLFTCGGCFACCYNCNGLCGPKYSNTALRAALIDRFGDMTLGQVLTPIQIVAYDIEQNKPIYFNSKDHPKMRMVDAALASSAAPTYFPAVTVSDGKDSYYCVDGGLFDNCSSLAALRFAIQNYERKFCKRNTGNEKLEEVFRFDDFTVVSIGTGAKLEPSRVESLKRAGLLGWAKAAVEVSMTGTTQAVDYNMSEIFETRERATEKTKYFRFQAMISPSEAQMDDPSKSGPIRRRARRDGLGATPAYKKFINEHVESIQFRSILKALEQEEAQGIERILASQASANVEHK